MENITPETIEQPKKYELIEALKEKPVMLLAEKSEYTFEELEAIQKEHGAEILFACDFLIKGVEEYEKEGYFQNGKIINLDHHSDALSLIGKKISSANMVIEYLKTHPEDFGKKMILVSTHHTDCDSTLSTLILNGILPPEDRFGEAAICADHTGKPNEIADLMQALKHGPTGIAGDNATAEQNAKKYNFLVRNLQLFLNNEPIEPEAQKLLERHITQRSELTEIRERSEYKSHGDNGEIVYIETDPNSKFDATMLVDIFPDAKIIFTYFKKETKNKETGEITSGYVVNARAGQSVEHGFDLREIMTDAGEPFGGRWGGGANKRKTNGQGTTTEPDALAEKLYIAIKK